MTSDPQRKALTRRRFLATAALTAASTLTVGSAADAESPPSGDYDVIVVGGGFCGVTAARECRRMGYRTLLVEARDRIGGRTLTVDFEGRRVDLGGTWIHWSQPYVWTEALRSGLPLVESLGATADRQIVHTRNHDIVTLSNKDIGDDIDRAMAEYMGDARNTLPLPHNPFGSEAYRKLDGITSAERLDSLKFTPSHHSALYRDILDGDFASQGHNYTDQIAWIEMVRWYCLAGHNLSDMDDMSSRFRFRDGTLALLNFMLAEGQPEVRLSTPVRKVIEDGARVTVVTTRGEEITARLLISTVPLNVLRDIDWEPTLSAARLEACGQTHAGHGTKLHVVLDGDYGSINCTAPSRNALNSLFTDTILDGNTHLIGFGPDPSRLDINNTESVQKAVRLFLPHATVKQAFGHQWTDDPYAKGTWCTLRPHMWSRFLRELQKPTARIIFASADWANGFRGFIDGAIEQGLEAGRRARAVLGSSATTGA